MITSNRMMDLESHILNSDDDYGFDYGIGGGARWPHSISTQAEAQKLAGEALDRILGEAPEDDVLFDILNDTYVAYSNEAENIEDYEVVDTARVLPWFRDTVGIDLYCSGNDEGLAWSIWIINNFSETPYVLLAQDEETGEVGADLFYEWTD